MNPIERLADPRVIFPVLRTLAKRDWTSDLLTRSLRPFNPLDPRRYTNPYPMYEELRRHGPIYHHRRLGGWIFTGFDEAEQVLRGPVSVDRRAVTEVVAPYKHLAPETMETFHSLLLTVDPPRHTRLRGLVSRAFTPRAVASLEPRVIEVADELLDAIEAEVGRGGQRPVDVVERFTSQLPIYVIGELLGLPRQHRARLKDLSDIAVQFIDPLTGFDPTGMDTAIAELKAILDIEIENRRHQPTDDMLSALVRAEEDGRKLTTEELHSMVLLLMVAGHETTTGLIGNSLLCLDRDRDARSQLIESPELAVNAVEELLRFDSPVQATDRIAAEEFTINGVTFPVGASLTVLLGAANRDPRVNGSPNELRLDRPDPRLLSFGHGIHHCIGAALARLEARVALTMFVERFPDYRVSQGDSLTWKRSITLRGPTRLLLDVRP